jgi:hypothetical protein
LRATLSVGSIYNIMPFPGTTFGEVQKEKEKPDILFRFASPSVPPASRSRT